MKNWNLNLERPTWVLINGLKKRNRTINQFNVRIISEFGQGEINCLWDFRMTKGRTSTLDGRMNQRGGNATP